MTPVTTAAGRVVRSYPAPAWALARRGGAPAAPAGGESIPARPPGAGIGYGSGYYAGFLHHLGETAEMVRDYDRMALAEPAVKAAYQDKVCNVASLDLTVTPASKSPRDVEIAEGWKGAILGAGGGGPEVGVPHIVSNLAHAFGRGWVVCDYALRKEVETRGRWAGKRMIQSLKAKRPPTYELDVDDHLNVRGVWNTVGEREYHPADHIIHYAYFQQYADPLGTSDFRAAWRAYFCIRLATELRAKFLDKLTGGTLVAKNVPGGEIKAVLAALKEARGAGALALQTGIEAEVINIAAGSEAVFKSAIDDWNREIFISISGSHLPNQEGQTAGGRGKTDTQRGIAELRAWKFAADVGGLLTWAARRWVDENYAGADYPKAVKLGGIDPAAVLADIKLARELHDMGEPLSREELHSRSGWSAPNADDPRDALPGAPQKAAGSPGQPPAGFAEGGDVWTLEAVAG
jgi:hypothetical protein